MAKRISKILLSIGCSAFLLSGTALAQPEDDFGDEGMEDEGFGGEGMEDEGFGEEGMEPDAEPEPALEGEGDAAMAAPGMAFQGWPQEMVLRPTTLPKGAWSVGIDILADKSFESIIASVGCPPGALFIALPCAQSPSVSYGVSDQLQIDLGYAFLLKEFEAKGAIAAGVHFNVVRDDKLDISPAAAVGYDLVAEGLTPLIAGADIKFLLNDKMAIVSSPQHLVVTLDGDAKPVYLQLPVGFGFQATPMVYAEATTNLARIEISDADGLGGFIFADFIPVNLMGFYSMNNTMDIGAGLGLDLKADEVGDSLMWTLAFRYYGGVPGGGAAPVAGDM